MELGAVTRYQTITAPTGVRGGNFPHECSPTVSEHT